MYIENLIDDVNKTHSNLGNLIAMSQVAVKARKFTLIVSPSGCGKSKAMDYICKNTPDSWQPLNVSISSLFNKVDKLASFRSVIGIDDISSIQTIYGRVTTLTTLSQLCYTHRVEPSMVGYDFCLEDFYGSALIGIQPFILKDLVMSPEWESHIRDKALRYYHMQRPTEPNINMPIAQIETGTDFDAVKFEPDNGYSKWQDLIKLLRNQFGIARSKEHAIDFLKAVASLENRIEVIENDYDILLKLLKPIAIENIVLTKNSLEGNSILDNDLLALLVEYYTYNGDFSLAHVAQDFNIRLAYAYRIMGSQDGNWQQISKSPTIYRASKKLLKTLKEYNLEIKE